MENVDQPLVLAGLKYHIHIGTKNKSFVTTSNILAEKGIKNSRFMLALKDKDLANIDPFDESRNLVTESDALLPMFKAIKKKLKEQGCKRAILVGHNAHFDHSFIFAAIDRLKAASKSPFHPFSVIDTASLSMLMLGQSVLQKACYAAHVDFDQNCAHGAAYDTRKETELFCAILNRFTKFCGMPEPVDIEIDYNNSKNKECDTESKDSAQDSCVCDSD